MATQTLNSVTNARPEDWVSLTWAPPKRVASLQPSFITDANDELPATTTVYYRNGKYDPTTGNLAISELRAQ